VFTVKSHRGDNFGPGFFFCKSSGDVGVSTVSTVKSHRGDNTLHLAHMQVCQHSLSPLTTCPFLIPLLGCYASSRPTSQSPPHSLATLRLQYSVSYPLPCLISHHDPHPNPNTCPPRPPPSRCPGCSSVASAARPWCRPRRWWRVLRLLPVWWRCGAITVPGASVARCGPCSSRRGREESRPNAR
jgi:hypothetical protein